MLLERRGQVVTREELQKRIWPSDTFVDFEQGLYNATKRLREALPIRPKRRASLRHCLAKATVS